MAKSEQAGGVLGAAGYVSLGQYTGDEARAIGCEGVAGKKCVGDGVSMVVIGTQPVIIDCYWWLVAVNLLLVCKLLLK